MFYIPLTSIFRKIGLLIIDTEKIRHLFVIKVSYFDIQIALTILSYPKII